MSYAAIGALAAYSGLGTLMRDNPLPIGRYWIDVFGDNRDKLALWFRQNRDTVDALTTESFDKNPGGPARDFYIFRVKAPTTFEAVTFGFPTVAGSNVQSSDDTVQRPDPVTTEQVVQSTLDQVGKIAFYGLLLVGGVLALKTFDALGFLTRDK